MPKRLVLQDFIGRKYGKLEVIQFFRTKKVPTTEGYDNSVHIFLCRCDCGRQKEFIINNVTRGYSRSCGKCRERKINAMSRHPLYFLWNGNKQRGMLCDEWKKSFDVFIKDIDYPESAKKHLRRKDMTKKLSKDNFWWSDERENRMMEGLLTASRLARRTNLTRQRIEQIKYTQLAPYASLHDNGHTVFTEEAVEFLNNREKGKHPSTYMKNHDKITIEKNIPVPLRDKVEAFERFPFAQMDLGDSFFAPISVGALYQYSGKWKKKHDSHWKFIIRPVEGGARCWRTS